MAKKRDSAYYRERLKRDHPNIYSDLVAGRYKSVREASAKARLIKIPSRLDALKREWNRTIRSSELSSFAGFGQRYLD